MALPKLKRLCFTTMRKEMGGSFAPVGLLTQSERYAFCTCLPGYERDSYAVCGPMPLSDLVHRSVGEHPLETPIGLQQQFRADLADF